MKIISIKFLNLNSLKGQHEIRFDRLPFTEIGLFAITGPTGAGKTTILDAISAGLYGSVHRQKDVCEIMTRHTGEAFAEVEFEVNQKLYRAKWSVKRSRGKADGNLQSQRMELVDVSSGAPIISHPLKDVKEKIVSLCGLDYNQFLRSVMLCQGDFSKFLKADENERSELLEKITDTAIYSDISTFTFDKTKAEKEKLDALRNSLGGVTLLTDEELQTFQTNLARISAEANGLAHEKKVLENQVTWLQNLSRLRNRHLELQHDLEVFVASYEANQAKYERLAQHHKASRHLPLLTEMEAGARQVNEVNNKIRNFSLIVPELARESALLNTRFKDAEEKFKTSENTHREIVPVITEAEKKDVLISLKYGQLRKEQAEAGKASSELEKATADCQVKTVTLKIIKENITLLQLWLSKHMEDAKLEKTISAFQGNLERLVDLFTKIKSSSHERTRYEQQELLETQRLQKLKDHSAENERKIKSSAEQSGRYSQELLAAMERRSMEHWEADAGTLPYLLGIYEQQLDLANELQKSDEKVKELESIETVTGRQILIETGLLNETKIEHQRAGELLAVLEKNVELQLLIQKYEGDRKRLQPQQECPLCGSTHHPFVENDYTNERDAAEQQRDSEKLRLQAISKEMQNRQFALNALERDLQHAREQKAQTLVNQSITSRKFASNNQHLPAPVYKENPSNIQAVIEQKRREQTKLREKIHSIRMLENKLKEEKLVSTKLTETFLQIEGEIKTTESKLENTKDLINRVQVELDSYSVNEVELTARCVQLLAPYQLTFTYATGEQTLQSLTGRLTLFLQKQKDLNENQLRFNDTQSDIKHAEERINDKLLQIQQMEIQISKTQSELNELKQERFRLFGDRDTATERKAIEQDVLIKREQFEKARSEFRQKEQALEIEKNRYESLVKDLEELQIKHKELSLKLTNQLTGDHIESVSMLKDRFLPQEEAEQIEHEKQVSEKKKIGLERSLLDTISELKQEEEKDLTKETIDTLLRSIAEYETQISELNQELGSIKQRLKTDQNQKHRYQELASTITLQQKEYDRWNKLCHLIGSADGKKFSRFAQGLTLARLTELANRHLQKLSDRYLILKSPDKDLELQIVDAYQADVVRPVATLSGGESFLVSLALALGLSDLASKKVQINSLFIDEGFGTLDAETLDIAISALENLQANGKSIGIISHVETLKERIGTQIQVSKQPGGSSNVRIVSYGSEVVA